MAQLGHNTAWCARHVYQGSLKITGILCYRFQIPRKCVQMSNGLVKFCFVVFHVAN